MKFHFLYFIALFGFACNQSGKSKDPSSDTIRIKKSDTLARAYKPVQDWREDIDRLRDTNNKYLNLILDKVLTTVKLHINDSFYSGTIDTTVYHYENVYATFQFGKIFSSNRKHLLIKRFAKESEAFGTSLFASIYILNNKRFVKLISDTADIGFTEDTLIDVNRDGSKDYTISQYSGAGCCPRENMIAFLYDNANGSFKTVGFFNAEFDDKNKFVYEMDYGHPGEVSISKSWWEGLSKVKVELLSPNYFKDRPDSFVKPYSYVKTIYPSNKEIILKAIPDEYKSLQNLEYFLLYQK